MPFAIELFLDDRSAGAVRDLWRVLAEAGLDGWQLASGATPHVTLAVYPTLDLTTAAPAVAAVAAATPPLPVAFASIGCFPTNQGVVFLAPVVTGELLAVHQRCHAALAPVAPPSWTYYLSGHWVPHCTIGFELPVERIPAAVGLCHERGGLPLAGRFTRVGVVEFRPIIERCIWPLTG